MRQIIQSVKHPSYKVPGFLTDHPSAAISFAKHTAQFAYLAMSSADSDLFTTSVNEIFDRYVVLLRLKYR